MIKKSRESYLLCHGSFCKKMKFFSFLFDVIIKPVDCFMEKEGEYEAYFGMEAKESVLSDFIFF